MHFSKSEFRLQYFFIKGLFGDTDFKIDFDNNVKVFVGENGIGKTTILSVLFYTLRGNYKKLRTFDFKYIDLIIFPNINIHLEKEWLMIENSLEINKYYSRLEKYLTSEELLYLIRSVINGNINVSEFIRKYEKELNERNLPFPLHFLRNDIIRLRDELGDNENYLNYSQEIKNVDKNLEALKKFEILYFPTFRRIEEELDKLGLDFTERLGKVAESGVIQFGMKDVENLFENIKRQIYDRSYQIYTNITGSTIKNFIYKNDLVDDDMMMITIFENRDIVPIILDRFGKNLDEQDKSYIKELIDSNDIFDGNYSRLINFLYNLIKNYNEEREKDNSIKEFARVCNKYLVNKRVVFDESNGEIFIENEFRKKINLNNLSSGEKQIISIFSKIYLDFENEFIVLFDEPELSLSITWQVNFLPDILDSGKCKSLIAVTHSPFIFDNELDQYANSISDYLFRGGVE